MGVCFTVMFFHAHAADNAVNNIWRTVSQAVQSRPRHHEPRIDRPFHPEIAPVKIKCSRRRLIRDRHRWQFSVNTTHIIAIGADETLRVYHSFFQQRVQVSERKALQDLQECRGIVQAELPGSVGTKKDEWRARVFVVPRNRCAVRFTGMFDQFIFLQLRGVLRLGRVVK